MDIQSILHNLPPDFWFKTGVFLVFVLVLVLAYRIYHKSNKIFFSIVMAVVFAVIFFNWVYNRTEPAWMTPVIEKMAKIFPTKDYYRKESGMP